MVLYGWQQLSSSTVQHTKQYFCRWILLPLILGGRFFSEEVCRRLVQQWLAERRGRALRLRGERLVDYVTHDASQAEEQAHGVDQTQTISIPLHRQHQSADLLDSPT